MINAQLKQQAAMCAAKMQTSKGIACNMSALVIEFACFNIALSFPGQVKHDSQ